MFPVSLLFPRSLVKFVTLYGSLLFYLPWHTTCRTCKHNQRLDAISYAFFFLRACLCVVSCYNHWNTLSIACTRDISVNIYRRSRSIQIFRPRCNHYTNTIQAVYSSSSSSSSLLHATTSNRKILCSDKLPCNVTGALAFFRRPFCVRDTVADKNNWTDSGR